MKRRALPPRAAEVRGGPQRGASQLRLFGDEKSSEGKSLASHFFSHAPRAAQIASGAGKMSAPEAFRRAGENFASAARLDDVIAAAADVGIAGGAGLPTPGGGPAAATMAGHRGYAPAGSRPSSNRLSFASSDGFESELKTAQSVLTDGTFDWFSRPGLDERLVPVLRAGQAEIVRTPEKLRSAGHYLWTIQTMMEGGWAIKYFVPANEKAPLGHADFAKKTVYLNFNYALAPSLLQFAVLAQQLQLVYDFLTGRVLSSPKKDAPFEQDAPWALEAGLRSARAVEAFLDGVDMEALADAVPINHDPSFNLFWNRMEHRIATAWGGAFLKNLMEEGPTAEEALKRWREKLADLRHAQAYHQRALEGFKNDLESGALSDERRRDYAVGKQMAEVDAALSSGKAAAMARMVEGFERDARLQGDGPAWESPLSMDTARHRAILKFEALPTVAVPAQEAAIDPRLRGVAELLEETTLNPPVNPETRSYRFLLETIGRLAGFKGRRVLVSYDFSGSFAFFDPTLARLVVGWSLLFVHPVLAMLILAHELYHAADFLGVARSGEADPYTRPMSRDTEFGAFTAVAVYASNFDPNKIVEEILAQPGRYDIPLNMKLLERVFNPLKKFLAGPRSLEAMVSAMEGYSNAMGAQFQGLQTANAFLETTRYQYRAEEDLLKDNLLKAALATIPAGEAQTLLKVASFRRAKLRLLQRRIDQLERFIREQGDAGPPADLSLARPPGPSG